MDQIVRTLTMRSTSTMTLAFSKKLSFNSMILDLS